MTVNRTTLLDLPLPVTGTEAGTWGDTTNNGLSQYMDIAIAGMNSLTSANFTAGALTIANTQGDSSATNIAAGSAQYATIKVSSLAVNSTITAPSSNRSYRIINADATYSLTIKASGQTGVTFLPGQTGVVAFNGTDYVIVGVVGAGTATDNAVARFDGTTGKLVQNSVVTIADSTGDVAGVGALTMGGNLTLNGGTANGVLYLNGSKVATSGSALTFDGTNFGTTGNANLGSGSKSTDTQLNFASDLGTQRIYLDRSTRSLVFYDATTAIENYRIAGITGVQTWGVGGTEQMRLTSTGLGIGTSSLFTKFTVQDTERFEVSGGSGFTFSQSLNAARTATVEHRSYGSFLTWWTGAAGSQAERMRLDSSGNLGLGVTPSAWGAEPAFELRQAASLFGFSGTTNLLQNAYYDGSNWIYKNSAGAMLFQVGRDGHRFFTAPSGTAGNAITFTQAMTLDASGNLGVGTTSPVSRLAVAESNTDNVTVGVWNTSSYGSGNQWSRIQLGKIENVTYQPMAEIIARPDINTSSTSGSLLFYTRASGSTGERARITSGGDLLVGTTSATGNLTVAGGNGYAASITQTVTDNNVLLVAGTSSSNNQNYVVFAKSGTATGTIYYNGSIITYNATSDYRLKTVIGSVSGHGERIDALEPVEYIWNSNGLSARGFLAHKFQEVYPASVNGQKDAVDEDGNPVYQNMQASTSEVIADLVAEIQSLRKRLDVAGL